MQQYQIHATSEAGAVMVFGLSADGEWEAWHAARELLPWEPERLKVELVPPPADRLHMCVTVGVEREESRDGY